MLIIDELIPEERIKPLNKISEFYNPLDIVMFDIETTGLSPANSYIYLIGINYIHNNEWHITQLFNDDGHSEVEIIKRFMTIIKPYSYLMHFNGDTFDINFIRKRALILNQRYKQDIPDCFNSLTSIDLYRLIKPYKTALRLENVKQKTIEIYLGINRIDEMNGGQLIEVYFDYLKSKNKMFEKLLLQHNRDDMDGMYFLSSILSISALGNGDIQIQDINCDVDTENKLWFNIHFSLLHSIPKRITTSAYGIHLNCGEDKGLLKIPVINDELKYYFKNYKDYYYYPELDMAYDKSVKDISSTRENAKKCTCYVRRNGYFIPELDLDICDCFKDNNNSKFSYAELNDDFLGDKNKLLEYTTNIIYKVLHSK